MSISRNDEEKIRSVLDEWLIAPEATIPDWGTADIKIHFRDSAPAKMEVTITRSFLFDRGEHADA